MTNQKQLLYANDLEHKPENDASPTLDAEWAPYERRCMSEQRLHSKPAPPSAWIKRLPRLAAPTSASAIAPAARKLLRRALLALLIASVALGGTAPAGLARTAAAPMAPAAALAGAANAIGAAEEQPQSWLLKWRDPADAHELRGTEVLRRQNEAAVEVIRPADEDADVQAWLLRLRSLPGVEYVHPNYGVHILALPTETPTSASDAEATDPEASPAKGAQLEQLATTSTPNDPQLSKQSYLKQIGAPKAWETVREQTALTIAIIDTGVDLDHPDLKANLVPGANLVDPNKSPDDDNGHGTSVAGVIAAVGNNGAGISGILWKAKIMPIKALDSRGDGTEQELGEAILYAVRKGASIVVLSVGLHRYSPYMLDIVQYAESKGVLLVAAAGNEGMLQGAKAAVKYPAAYPTVLAVGGVKSNNTVDPRSNPGTELDLVAPWNVYTTAIGGLYQKEEGTSLAAPQVAAAAALVWARNKNMKPNQIRELLRQTAKDIGPTGIDSTSGYGVIQLDQAVRASLKSDGFEPNNKSTEAKRFQLGTHISAVLQRTSDQDWYKIDTSNDGTLTIYYEGVVGDGNAVPPMRMSQYTNGKLISKIDTKLSSRSIDFNVTKGQHLIQLELINKSVEVNLPYMLTSSFTIKQDEYERNDKISEAFTVQPRSQTIAGNFHQTADRDWFSVTFTQNGKLNLALSTDSARIDPCLAIQKTGQQLQLYDEEGEGENEQSPVITVTPGKYYIRVHNAISSEASPTIGTYKLLMEYTPKYDDPNEPNNKASSAFMAKAGTEYIGVIADDTDIDWFQYRISSASIVSMSVSGVPTNNDFKLEMYDKRLQLYTKTNSGTTGKLQTVEKLLEPGLYYIKLIADKPFDKQYYRFKIHAEEIVAGFRDINNHWAVSEIIDLTNRGIVNGIGSSRFEPARAITRAEAVAMVVKAYKPIQQNIPLSKPFKDVPAKHWAYDAVIKATQQGWIKGFHDGTFKPDQFITREEMAFIIGLADGVKPRLPLVDPFTDVSKTEWSAPMLNALKLNKKIKGVENNSYRPNSKASRADFTVLLHRVFLQ